MLPSGTLSLGGFFFFLTSLRMTIQLWLSKLACSHAGATVGATRASFPPPLSRRGTALEPKAKAIASRLHPRMLPARTAARPRPHLTSRFGGRTLGVHSAGMGVGKGKTEPRGGSHGQPVPARTLRVASDRNADLRRPPAHEPEKVSAYPAASEARPSHSQ